ncbi:MAG: molybdopterin-dependent oxidoreductase [Candidatus Bathyarchaeota archaeon]|nr:MAG: molybdopterin-dependent oxidoreductase [Candidatus Bathyarchaeota archaeon]
MLKKGKLPPGQVGTKEIRLRHIGEVPKINLSTWALRVYGRIKNPFLLTFKEIRNLPTVTIISDFHCVEGWSVLNNKWEGIPFKKIVHIAGPEKNIKTVVFECEDGYSTSLDLSDLLHKDVLLAYKLNDKMLEPDRGGPLRLVVPQKYAYKSAMWVRKIKFTDKHELGYWERMGYSDSANPWKEDRFAEQM